jgi:ABC-2 type transport system permease protein
MTKIMWSIARHEYLTSVRRPGFIFSTLFFPALGLVGLIVAAFFSQSVSDFFVSQFVPDSNASRNVGVVDQTGLYTPLPERHADLFVLYPDEAAARRDLEAEALGGYIVIPPDYVETGNVTAYTRQGGFNSLIALDSDVLEPFLLTGLLDGQVDDSLMARVADPANIRRIALEDDDRPGEASSPFTFSFGAGMITSYVLAILLFISIFTSSGYLLNSVSEEKESRVMEVILSSVSPIELLAGKIIGLGALGLTQVAVWILSAFLLSGGIGLVATGVAVALNPGNFLLAAVYFILGYLIFGTLMATAGSLGTTMRESQQIAGIFSMAAAIPWMLNGFIFMNPNMPLARVLSYIPLTAPMMMMLRTAIGSVPPVDIIGSIIVLVVSIPIILWAGAKIFRTSLLIYGKRLTVKEIVLALRAA